MEAEVIVMRLETLETVSLKIGLCHSIICHKAAQRIRWLFCQPIAHISEIVDEDSARFITMYIHYA